MATGLLQNRVSVHGCGKREISVNPNLAVLQKAALFHDLGAAALGEIAALGQPRAVEEGSFFFMQGDEARYVYVLSLGRVKLTQTTVDGQQVAMRMLGPGQMFAGRPFCTPKMVTR